MRVTVMDVGVMRMAMNEPRMGVNVNMGFASRIVGPMSVSVVRVVRMRVFVDERFVFVFVLVVFHEMQVEARRHQSCSSQELWRDRLAKDDDRDDRANEGSSREIGPGAGGPELAEGEHEEDEAHAIAEEANDGTSDRKLRDGQGRASKQRQPHIDGTGDKPLRQRDLNRIGRRQLPGQIVVDAPGKARADDGERAPADFDAAFP